MVSSLRSINTLNCDCPLPGLNSTGHVPTVFSANKVGPMKTKALILFFSMASYIWSFSASIPFHACLD